MKKFKLLLAVVVILAILTSFTASTFAATTLVTTDTFKYYRQSKVWGGDWVQYDGITWTKYITYGYGGFTSTNWTQTTYPPESLLWRYKTVHKHWTYYDAYGNPI